MENENTLARNISVADAKAALDAACKRLLANKSILAWILKDCVEEYRGCDIQEIESFIESEPQIAEIAVNPDETGASIKGMSNEDVTITEGIVTYDIRFMASAPKSGELIQLIINIEAQNDFYPGYPLITRGIYYCSRMISAQYGTEFTQSHYGNIKKVYSIWVCANPPKSRENSITSYSITEKNLVGNVKEKAENYDLMTSVMVCLGGMDDSKSSGVLRLLEVLLSSEVHAEEKKQILQGDFNIKMTQKFDGEVSEMCNLSKGIEERGIAKGMEQGRTEERVALIRNIIFKMNMTPIQAMQLMDIKEDEYSKYEKLLKDYSTKE